MLSFCFAVILSLSPLASLQSPTGNPSKPAADTSEVAEANRLAAEMVKLYKQGKYKEALPLAKRCLQIREKIFTPADDALRIALRNLAEVYMALEKYDDAEPLFQRLVKSYEDVAPDDIRLVAVLQSLGTTKFVTGQSGDAEKCFRRALEITEKAYAPDSKKVADAATYLADYYQAVGDYKNAEPLYQRMFTIAQKLAANGSAEDLERARASYICVLRKVGNEARLKQLEDRGSSPPTGTDPATGEIINSKAVSMPKPDYPAEARAARASGTVKVQVVVDETGRVIQACAVEGPPLLRRTSEVAAYKALFSPTKLSGQPVKVVGIIAYKYLISY